MRKIYHLFLLLSRGKQIALVVCLLHLLAIFGLLGHHLISRRMKPPRTIIVKTIHAERRIENIKREEVIASVEQLVQNDKSANPKP